MLWQILTIVGFLVPFAVLFGISRIFVPWRLAIRMALLMMVAGLAIFSGGLELLSQIDKHALQGPGMPRLLVIAAVLAVAGMIITGVVFVRWVRKRSRRAADAFD